MKSILVLLLLIFPISSYACTAMSTHQLLTNIFITGSLLTLFITTLITLIFVITTRVVPRYRLRGTEWLLKRTAFIYGIGVVIFIVLYSIFLGLAFYSGHTEGMSVLETLNHNPCDEWMRESM